MRTITAAVGSVAFLLIAPGGVAGLVPWWLTGWQAGAAYPEPVQITGAVLAAAGAAALLAAFAQFATQGRGTPAPPAPTEQLVVRGLYRYVRNPMYLAVLAVITGQALLLSRPVLLGYAAAVAAASIAFVYGYEQPTLARRFGAQYEAYRRAVPGWWPRLPPAHARAGSCWSRRWPDRCGEARRARQRHGTGQQHRRQEDQVHDSGRGPPFE